MASAGLPTPPILVTAEDVHAGKPDPAPYLPAAERLGISPRDCLAIEDAPAGLESARRAGCKTLAVLTTHERDDLTADLIATDLTKVRIERRGETFTVHTTE
jgi:sugar-phosphatase